MEQPDSEHVRNLTDALILIKERDPAKRKALLDDAARTGKSIRSAKQRARNREIPKDPAERSRGLTQEALRIFHRLWTQDTSVPTLRDGEPQQWIEKAQGSTAKEIAHDAYRLLKLSLSAAPPDAQAPEEPSANDTDRKPRTYQFIASDEIGTLFAKPVKMELSDTEFKILNKGLNPATPDPEVEVCAVKFFQSYRKRYSSVRQIGH